MKYLLILFCLLIPKLSLADPYVLEFLDTPIILSGPGAGEPPAELRKQFPYMDGQTNNMGIKIYGSNIIFMGKEIFSRCLLRNSSKYVDSIVGSNDQNDLLVEAFDGASSRRYAILRWTGEKPTSFCPLVTWSVNKECTKNFLYNCFDEKKFPKKVDYNTLCVTQSYCSAINNKFINPRCKFNVKVTSPNTGKPISNLNLITSVSKETGTKLLRATKTNKKGEASISLPNSTNVLQEFCEQCQEFRVTTPYADKKWRSNSILMWACWSA